MDVGRLIVAMVMLAAVAVPMSAAVAADWTERDVSMNGLHGTLTAPSGDNQVPAVLILAGSGPVDRDGNINGSKGDKLKMLAHALAAQGVISLRIDKRGIGTSRTTVVREVDLRFQTYVDDAKVWLAFLRAEPRVSRVIILGHSEGALIGTLVAKEAGPSGLILLAGAGNAAPVLLGRQLAAAGLPPDLQETSRRIADSLTEGKPVADIPAALMALYRPSVQPYLMSWFPLDPASELAKVTCPVLIVQGTTDLQVTVEEAQRLHAARPDARFVLIEGMNHALKTAPLDRSANIRTYAAPNRPLADGLVPALVAFLGP